MTSKEFFKQAREVYSWMEDEQSKRIFEARFALSGTGSVRYVDQLIQLGNPVIQEKINLKKDFLSKFSKIVLYGAGELGQNFYHQFQLQNRDVCFCDKEYKTINSIGGVPVISPEVLMQSDPDTVIVICAGPGYQHIYQYLRNTGFATENICTYCETDESIYFDDIIVLSDHEVFVDAGSFDGTECIKFASRCKACKLIAFEPDKGNIQKIERNFEEHKIENYKIFDTGLWSSEEILRFSENGSGASMIKEDGNVSIHCDKLDHILEHEKVTFIKMDIEGAELEALKGAEQLIKKNRPKLAISIYHKPNDIIDLPRYIKSLVPDYKFYLRHYTNTDGDTVLYAIV